MSNDILDKLHYKNNLNITLINCPQELHDILTPASQNDSSVPFIIAFFQDANSIKNNLDKIISLYKESGYLWCAYPKKSGAIKSDISRDKGWEPFISHNLIPVSQISLDSTWSALRFRYKSEVKKLTRSF